jgi:hypothetical protein
MKQILRDSAILFLLILSFFSSAQKPDALEKLEAIVESVVENLEEDADATQITEDLEMLAENPLNINAATEVQLERLHILNTVQIRKLLKYRDEFGPVYSIFELNSIDGISRDLLEKMEPFTWFGPVEKTPEKISTALKYSRQQILLRSQSLLQQQRGYKAKDGGSVPYEGNSFRYYARYNFKASEKISAGLTAEKDPGESFFSGSNTTGFDFYSGYLKIEINPVIQNIVIGDYMIRAGQGLVLWQGFSMSKSLYSMEVYKTGQGIRPFTSTDENQFFRGVATTFEFGNGTLELFYSNKTRDGNPDFDDSTGSFFTSLQTSGYHRTESEIDDERSVKDQNFGGTFHWNFRNLRIGATAIHQKFNIPFIRSDQLYNLFRFRGKENFTAGTDYLFSKGKYQLFGEAAISQSGGKAFLQGATAHLHDRLGFSILIRHFDKDYHALWANPFSESGSENNESGIYFGTRILPVKFITLTAYSDFYHFEWLTFTTAGPATGREIFVQSEFVFSEDFQFYVRHKNEEKEQKFNLDKHHINLPEKNAKTRIHFQYRLIDEFQLKTRFEHVRYHGLETENGFMVYQDIKYSPKKSPFSASCRIVWFNTESYNSRIYAYENDILYAFSIPAFFGRGWRSYLNLGYAVSDKIDFWFKLGNTLWTDRETISSGNSEIDGNKKTELKFQLRLKI